MKKQFQPLSTFSIRRFDFLLVTMVILLNLIGTAAIRSANPSYMTRQVYGMLSGIAIMFVLSAIDYRKLVNLGWLYYLACIAVLLLVIRFGEGRDQARRWITIAGIRFQPAETAKLLLILFYAKFIMRHKNKAKSFGFLLICIAIAAIPFYLIYKQPDLSTSIMVLVIIAVILFVSEVLSYRLVGSFLLISVPSVIIFIYVAIQEGATILEEFQKNRLLAWLHPEEYALTTAMQTMNSMMAIGSGQLLGKGYNTKEITSLLSTGYISESQTDFIFTVVGEEFGFAGACSVVALLAFISVRCFMTARTADFPGRIIASGMGAWIGFQGFMNIGVVTGVLPNTGIPLPFVSYGLTSLWALYMGIGLVLNVRMQNRPKAA